MKLMHLVDDKIHARSTGRIRWLPSNRSAARRNSAGSASARWRCGRWRHMAQHTLQELLTVKSDDIAGRVKTYEAIVKGDNVPEPGVPESFKVLIKELQSLCLDVKVLSDDEHEIEIREADDDIEGTARELGIDIGDRSGRIDRIGGPYRETEAADAILEGQGDGLGEDEGEEKDESADSSESDANDSDDDKID